MKLSALGECKGARKWDARLIAEGAGSTAYYTEEALVSSFADAFPVGTHMYIDHSTVEEEDARPEGSLHNLAGVIASTPEWRSEPVPGMYATIEVSERWATLIEEFSPHIGLSVRASGTVDDEGNLLSFTPSPLNSIDFVTVAGANGKLVRAIESYKAEVAQNIVENSTSNERRMVEEIKAALAALDTKFSALMEALAKPEKEKQDAEAEKKKKEEEEKKTKEAIVALVSSDLPEASIKRVAEAIAAGHGAQVLKRETEIVESVRKSLIGDGSAPEPVGSDSIVSEYEALEW